jgi:hypothetical protein
MRWVAVCVFFPDMSLRSNWATSLYLVLRGLGFLCWPNLTDHPTDLLRRIEPDASASIEVPARTDSNSLPVALPGTSIGARDDFNCGLTLSWTGRIAVSKTAPQCRRILSGPCGWFRTSKVL